jgi:UDP-N-acetylglucosamine--N-acetylmuramyl-(pentapeptide) pyrophosphoryl-undecaprenol N-acetylglucosamine transferase
MEKFFPGEKIVLTGNPVRASISESKLTREQGLQFFGLDPLRPAVLSIGGSQGAQSINDAVSRHINAFAENNIQLIWQTGVPFLERAKELVAGRPGIWVNDFITRMEYAFAAADVIISRAGAMAIAEICVVKKPVIMVPLPTAAEDHQTINAMSLVKRNAGMMIPDNEAAEKLVPAIIELARDTQKQETLKNNISEMAFRDADMRIAGEILKKIKPDLADVG